ncbi:MAG TPA: Holliday junction branch migration protein RuvA [Candidatus Peribacteraceae bacterium]|nr:Holliday junction branch migration protein RuvA [Candidatus Peribacteraceae bacterium]
MIERLRGTVHKLQPGKLSVDVADVGYMVSVPMDVWETAPDGASTTLYISPYIREDRFELYGFLDQAGRSLFEALIAQSGIGPKLGLELCSVPRGLLLQAVKTEDAALLSTIKGIGKKMAEKLLIELKNLAEKQPGLFGTTLAGASSVDQDAVAALESLGYDTSKILQALKQQPAKLKTTEERVTAALQSL